MTPKTIIMGVKLKPLDFIRDFLVFLLEANVYGFIKIRLEHYDFINNQVYCFFQLSLLS